MDDATVITGEVGKLSEVIYNYGPTVVIIAAFIILFILVILYILRIQQKSNEHMLEEHKLLIQSLIEMQKSTEEEPVKKEKPINKDLMNSFMKISNVLKSHIAANVVMLDARRIGVYLFHNGTHATSGFPFFKFSCICEKMTNPHDARIRYHKDFPVNLIGDFVNDIYNKTTDKYYDPNHTEPLDPVFIKLLCNEEDKCLIRGIFDTDSNLLGFILAEFRVDHFDSSSYSTKSDIMDQLAANITPILEFSDINNTYKGGEDK